MDSPTTMGHYFGWIQLLAVVLATTSTVWARSYVSSSSPAFWVRGGTRSSEQKWLIAKSTTAGRDEE